MSTYLVTGVNRGVGFGFVKELVANPKNSVIGTVRKGANTNELLALNCPNLKLIYIDFTDELEKVVEAFKDLDKLAPNGIDVVVANAGVGPSGMPALHEVPMDEFNELFNINVGNVKLYKAIHPFLETKPVKLVFVSSVAGQIADMMYPVGAYGASKAALNYMAKQVAIDRKDKKDVVISIHPGTVATPMMIGFQDIDGVVLISPEESAQKVVKLIENLKPEDSGKFFNYTGEILTY